MNGDEYKAERASPKAQRRKREIEKELADHRRAATEQARSDKAAKARQDRREMKSESKIKPPTSQAREDAELGPERAAARARLSGDDTEPGRANNIEYELRKEFRKADGRSPDAREKSNLRRKAEHLTKQGYTAWNAPASSPRSTRRRCGELRGASHRGCRPPRARRSSARRSARSSGATA